MVVVLPETVQPDEAEHRRGGQFEVDAVQDGPRRHSACAAPRTRNAGFAAFTSASVYEQIVHLDLLDPAELFKFRHVDDRKVADDRDQLGPIPDMLLLEFQQTVHAHLLQFGIALPDAGLLRDRAAPRSVLPRSLPES